MLLLCVSAILSADYGRWMKVDENGWKWIEIYESGCNSMKVCKNEWKLVKVDETRWKWIKVNESGWIKIKWIKWRKMDDGATSLFYVLLYHKLTACYQFQKSDKPQPWVGLFSNNEGRATRKLKAMYFFFCVRIYTHFAVFSSASCPAAAALLIFAAKWGGSDPSWEWTRANITFQTSME